jgi:hypothetical protein
LSSNLRELSTQAVVVLNSAGKTRLLSAIVSESPMPVFCGAANPFEMSRPLSVWSDIFVNLIDSELDRKREPVCEIAD